MVGKPSAVKSNEFAVESPPSDPVRSDSSGELQTIGGFQYERTSLGMLRQVAPAPFVYDASYLQRQSTTPEMSYLRLGYLLAQIPYDRLRSCQVLELGPGKGVFFEILKPHVRVLEGHDAAAESVYNTICWEDATAREWDLVVAFDVLEHFPDIDVLWQLPFEYGLFSIPSPPAGGVHAAWRHFKPNEHLWHITASQFALWVAAHGYSTVASGCPEDCIRNRWNPGESNINSFVIQRNPVPRIPPKTVVE